LLYSHSRREMAGYHGNGGWQHAAALEPAAHAAQPSGLMSRAGSQRPPESLSWKRQEGMHPNRQQQGPGACFPDPLPLLFAPTPSPAALPASLPPRSRWNKAGADMTEDEVASMSTDQSGEGGGPWLWMSLVNFPFTEHCTAEQTYAHSHKCDHAEKSLPWACIPEWAMRICTPASCAQMHSP
jgi:hypothetical protein